MFHISFHSNPWSLILCVIAGVIYAGILYYNDKKFNLSLKRILFFLRFTLVTILTFLLLKPFLQIKENIIEKPFVAIAIDNSESINLASNPTLLKNIKSFITKLKTRLNENDTEMKIYSLDKESNISTIDSIYFNYEITNLSSLFNKIYNQSENLNLSSIVLFSDGIYNQGVSPEFLHHSKPVYCVTLGDTLEKKDVLIQNIIGNKTVYKGNTLQLLSEVSSKGFQGHKIKITLKLNNKIMESREIAIQSNNEFIQTGFTIKPDSSGKNKIDLIISRLDGELTYINNQRSYYFDVIDSKEKILILAAVPHPDIKAIRQVLETNQVYEIETLILSSNNKPPANTKYDLVILHQIPNKWSLGNEYLEKLIKDNISCCFIMGSATDFNAFNHLNLGLKIDQNKQEWDQVLPALNPKFDKFSIEEKAQFFFNNCPPVQVPFGSYEVSDNVDIIFNQKIGNTISRNPLLMSVQSSGKKFAFLIGEGIWKWRMQEFNQTDQDEQFKHFILNLFQFLSMKDDKRKFRFYPINNEFNETNKVIFETECYNELMEKVYEKEIKIELKRMPEDFLLNSKPEIFPFSFITSEKFSQLNAGSLKPGIYHFLAKTTLNNQNETVSGGFVVKKLQLEELNLTANNFMLQNLSNQSGGKMYLPEKIDSLIIDLLKSKATQKIIYTTEREKDLINIKMLFLILIIIISLEWFLRRYNGSY